MKKKTYFFPKEQKHRNELINQIILILLLVFIDCVKNQSQKLMCKTWSSRVKTERRKVENLSSWNVVNWVIPLRYTIGAKKIVSVDYAHPQQKSDHHHPKTHFLFQKPGDNKFYSVHAQQTSRFFRYLIRNRLAGSPFGSQNTSCLTRYKNQEERKREKNR